MKKYKSCTAEIGFFCTKHQVIHKITDMKKSQMRSEKEINMTFRCKECNLLFKIKEIGKFGFRKAEDLCCPICQWGVLGVEKGDENSQKRN